MIVKETKHDKFKRLAVNRTNNALKNIDLLKNLSNKQSYDYTKEEIEKIIRVLRSAINELEKTFNSLERNSKFEL